MYLVGMMLLLFILIQNVLMTEFTNEVEKQRALLELEEWRKQVKYLHSNRGLKIVKFNDESKYIYKAGTNILIDSIPSPHRRRTLIDMMFIFP